MCTQCVLEHDPGLVSRIRTPGETLEINFHGPDSFVLGSQWEDVAVCDF